MDILIAHFFICNREKTNCNIIKLHSIPYYINRASSEGFFVEETATKEFTLDTKILCILECVFAKKDLCYFLIGKLSLSFI